MAPARFSGVRIGDLGIRLEWTGRFSQHSGGYETIRRISLRRVRRCRGSVSDGRMRLQGGEGRLRGNASQPEQLSLAYGFLV